MTFAAPGYLAAALAVAAAIAALHLLVLRAPPAVPLPTARFVPAGTTTVRRLTRLPVDRVLLALRILTILLAGAAFARPTLRARRVALTRIVAVDHSAAVASMGEAADSAARYIANGAIVVPFDTIAAPAVADAPLPPRSNAPGSLSAGLVAALRAASRAAAGADSIELVVVSPFTSAEVDAATIAIRSQWRAAIRAVRIAPASVTASFDLVRVVAGVPTAADSAWARGGRHALIVWPRPDSGVRYDTVGAVATSCGVVIAPFVRLRRLSDGHPIARWVDGEPAVVERPLGAGTVRDVAIGTTDPPPRLLSAITSPCGTGGAVPLSDSAVRAFGGTGSKHAAIVAGAARAGRGNRNVVVTLLALALIAALAEPLVRRRA